MPMWKPTILQQAIQDKLGKDLSWFFDQWILRGGEPQYTVRHEDVMKANGSRRPKLPLNKTHLRDEVVGLFKMPIVFEVHYIDGSSDKVTEWIDEQTQLVRIDNRGHKEIVFVLFDP